MERCPAGEPIKDELIGQPAVCVEFSASGDFDAAANARIYAADAQCNEMTITNWLDRLVIFDGKDQVQGTSRNFVLRGPFENERPSCCL